MSEEKIQELEEKIYELGCELRALREAEPGVEVPNYTLDTIEGEVTLLDLFGDKDKLLAIHNMGQGCRYCTLWGDGFNPFVPHLEAFIAVVMLSKDDPATQRRFANHRGWRFRMASHGGGKYLQEQNANERYDNCPGAVCYERRGDTIFRLNRCAFGPGDLYCSVWHMMGLAGLDSEDWTPQYNYWRRPQTLDDGGANVVD